MEFFTFLSALLLLLSVQPLVPVHGDPSVNLIFPPPGKAGKELSFTAGHKLHIQWESSFSHIRLQIWQGPNGKGTLAFLTLLSELESRLRSNNSH